MAIGSDVVLVEDDEDLRDSLAAAIGYEGLAVRAVGSAAEAVEEVRCARPAVVLMDVFFGGGGARAVVSRLRADAKMREVPVVLVSGAQDVRRQAQQLGAAGSLRKPFSIAELVEVLRPYCGRFASGSAPPVGFVDVAP